MLKHRLAAPSVISQTRIDPEGRTAMYTYSLPYVIAALGTRCHSKNTELVAVVVAKLYAIPERPGLVTLGIAVPVPIN